VTIYEPSDYMEETAAQADKDLHEQMLMQQAAVACALTGLTPPDGLHQTLLAESGLFKSDAA
jgi:hypothetical protein